MHDYVNIYPAKTNWDRYFVIQVQAETADPSRSQNVGQFNTLTCSHRNLYTSCCSCVSALTRPHSQVNLSVFAVNAIQNHVNTYRMRFSMDCSFTFMSERMEQEVRSYGCIIHWGQNFMEGIFFFQLSGQNSLVIIHLQTNMGKWKQVTWNSFSQVNLSIMFLSNQDLQV